MPEPTFRNASTKCLTEIACIKMGEEFDRYFVQFLNLFMNRLAAIIPAETGLYITNEFFLSFFFFSFSPHSFYSYH